jgi:hypothetical protein
MIKKFSKKSSKRSSKKTSKKSSKKTFKKSSKKTSRKSSKNVSGKSNYKYKNRPSPPVSAQDHPNEIMIGNDNNEYKSEKDKNGIYRWKKYNKLEKYVGDENYRIFDKSIKTKYHKNSYMIHDNGGRPFYVEIYPKEIKIFKNIIDDYEEYGTLYKHEISFYNYKKVFVGKSPLTEMTKHSGGHGKMFDGNSILVELKKHLYLEIGYIIYTFETDEEIVEYISEVGNSDVPYPIAFSKNNTYLILEYVYFPILDDTIDAYRAYWNKDIDKKTIKKFKKVKIIIDRNE